MNSSAWGPAGQDPGDAGDGPHAPATVTFGEAVARGLQLFVTFSGRASRSEYWWFFLFVLLASFGTALLVEAAVGADGEAFIGLVVLALMVPHLAVASRRLHDTDKSAWWLLIVLVPFGGVVLLVLLALEPTPGPNRFGPAPA